MTYYDDDCENEEEIDEHEKQEAEKKAAELQTAVADIASKLNLSPEGTQDMAKRVATLICEHLIVSVRNSLTTVVKAECGFQDECS